MTDDRRQHAARPLDDEAEIDAHREGEDHVHAGDVDVQHAEAGRGRRDAARCAPRLDQTCLHVAAEEQLFGHARDHAQDDDRREQVGTDRALEHPPDDHHRPALA